MLPRCLDAREALFVRVCYDTALAGRCLDACDALFVRVCCDTALAGRCLDHRDALFIRVCCDTALAGRFLGARDVDSCTERFRFAQRPHSVCVCEVTGGVSCEVGLLLAESRR